MIPEAIVTVDGTDVSCSVELGASIAHGRATPVEQPEPATASFAFIAADAGTVNRLQINAVITVDARIGATVLRRFAGLITDVTVSWETPDLANVTVLAASQVAMLGRTFVGDAPWPEEIDGARATRILGGETIAPIGQIDPGTVAILARDIDRQPILALLQALAVDAAGLAWYTRDGHINYADAEHRRNTPSKLTLDCGQVLMSPVWVMSTDGLTNEITVSYGAVPEGGEQSTVQSVSLTSQTQFGRLAESMTTTLAAAADATARANAAIARRSFPHWNLPALPVELSLASIGETLTADLLSLETHDLITVTGFPSQGPYSTAALWVEGWTEEISSIGGMGGTWLLTLNVSAYCQTSAYVRWDDLSPGWTWDTFPPVTWDEASCMGPPLPGEQWHDVPADHRWDSIPASVTWDTWNQFVGA